MNFGLVRHVTEDILEKTSFINDWSQELSKFFENRTYGHDVESFVIGITSVSPQFEQFFKVKKPKYTENKTETHDGISVEIKKSYEYGLKLDYKRVIDESIQELEPYLATEIIQSLSYLNSLPKKIKDFDKEGFRRDLEEFFKERGLI